jgi:hypothetical protein
MDTIRGSPHARLDNGRIRDIGRAPTASRTSDVRNPCPTSASQLATAPMSFETDQRVGRCPRSIDQEPNCREAWMPGALVDYA